MAGLLHSARVALPRSRARRGSRAASPAPGDAPAREDAAELPLPDEALARELLAGFRRFVGAAGEGAVTLSEASVALGERRERIATTAGREAGWTTRAASLVGTVVGRSAGGRISTEPGGPDARIHYEYHSRQHSPAYAGERLIVSGKITDRYVKRGRTYIDYYLEVRTAEGRLVTTYTDKTLLKYGREGEHRR